MKNLQLTVTKEVIPF